MHWIIHGIHHEHPNDPLRLVMPPAVSIPLGALVFGVLYLMFGKHYAPGVGAGFFAGYLVYDMLHYYVHHFRPHSRIGRVLRERHMRHHFQDDTKGFGISAPYWDEVSFGSPPCARAVALAFARLATPRREGTSRGCHKHQPGRDDRQPDRDPELRSAAERLVSVQAAGSPATRAARTAAAASGSTSPTTST